MAHVAKDLTIHKAALRGWVPKAEVDHGQHDDRLPTGERDELRQLPKENAELKRANEILKAASVFFAREINRIWRPRTPPGTFPTPAPAPAPAPVAGVGVGSRDSTISARTHCRGQPRPRGLRGGRRPARKVHRPSERLSFTGATERGLHCLHDASTLAYVSRGDGASVRAVRRCPARRDVGLLPPSVRR
ncbi:transposase [Streptomyces sp. NPDC102467]|uniref:transposase n=1 Tax=Streptomyces sp. NPDC102467 TaxID=3366179 RepID=UPI0038063FD5